jgi:hypothetical protein
VVKPARIAVPLLLDPPSTSEHIDYIFALVLDTLGRGAKHIDRYVWSAAGLQAETSDGGLVCASVFGLFRDLRSLAVMDSARSFPISYVALVSRYRYQV